MSHTKSLATAFALTLAILLAYAFSACSREDGLPDPPVRSLVPCVPDAGEDDPLACPAMPEVDLGSEDLTTSADLGN